MSVPKLIDVTPFEPLIIKAHYDGFDWEKLKPVCQKMIDDTSVPVEVEGEHGKSSVYNRQNMPQSNPAFKDFYNWLNPIVQHIIKNEWGYEKSFMYVNTNSWVNVHKKGGITLEHHHGPCILVAATYLQLPEEGGYIEYKDPMEYSKGMNQHHNVDDWVWKKVPAKTGDVLLFPGWIRHRTEHSRTNDERWVLTTNYMSLHRPNM